jgi:hypothetical protein
LGTNELTVTARDAAGNQSSDTLTVTYDPTPPTITIAGPTTASTYLTGASVITLGGTAADNIGITAVTWANSAGGTGFASGTRTWSVASISLSLGTNVITVTAQDAAGNRRTDVLTVTRRERSPVGHLKWNLDDRLATVSGAHGLRRPASPRSWNQLWRRSGTRTMSAHESVSWRVHVGGGRRSGCRSVG